MVTNGKIVTENHSLAHCAVTTREVLSSHMYQFISYHRYFSENFKFNVIKLNLDLLSFSYKSFHDEDQTYVSRSSVPDAIQHLRLQRR